MTKAPPKNLPQKLNPGFFFTILGRGPRAFQIGKISMVNPKTGKFVSSQLQHFGQLKNKLAITHTIASKLKAK